MDSVSLYPIVFCGEQAGNQPSPYHRGRGRNFEKGETCGSHHLFQQLQPEEMEEIYHP